MIIISNSNKHKIKIFLILRVTAAVQKLQNIIKNPSSKFIYSGESNSEDFPYYEPKSGSQVRRRTIMERM